MERESLVVWDIGSVNRSNIVKNLSTPDISLLHVVETLVAISHKLVNSSWISDFIELSIVSR